MRRWLYHLGAILLAATWLVGPVSAANLNDFVITNYDMQLQLDRDSSGRSILTTTEKITAKFPLTDQNHGIERSIPTRYDGHSTSLEIISVLRPDGSDWQYSTRDGYRDSRILRIGSPSQYAHGEQTYIITYQQRDVTKHFEAENHDEFYWDTNGTAWQVPINRLAVRLEVDPTLIPKLNGDKTCYRGGEGSAGRCQLESTADGVYATEARGLSTGENITLAVGFEPNSFTGYQMPLIQKLLIAWAMLQLVLVPVALGLIIWIALRFWRTVNRSREVGTIIPEYLPPDVSVTTAAKIARGVRGSVMAAQLIDLAVRHYITLTESETKLLFGKIKTYSIETIKAIDDLKPEEQELLDDMFGHRPSVGERLNLRTLQNNTSYYNRTTDNDKKLRQLIVDEYGLKQTDQPLKRWLRRTALIGLLIGLIGLSPMLLIAALVAFVMSFFARSLTDEGLALRRYLAGLRDYIKVGEAERLKMLQSPTGAEKVADLASDPTDSRQRLVLYERVLPYAVLFGQEKDWTRQLGKYYEQAGQQPDWYSGAAAFNAASFSSSLGGFSTATSSYGGASSSSSSGSSGGGFSGGGGGGGGGGGW